MTDYRTATSKVAYLVSAYPKLSHSFIASEITGLRELGVQVDTFSINDPTDADVLTPSSQAEARTTTNLISTAKRRPLGLMLRALMHPRVALVGLTAAARIAARPATLKWLFYWVEAMVLITELESRGIRHVHVHLANNAADVAHAAVAMGRRLDGRRWTWSLAVHGPNELNDTSGYNLPGKVTSAHFVACITEYCRSQVMALTSYERWADLHVVRMGIAPDDFPLVDRGGRSGRAPVRVLFVGRLVGEKAPMLLLQAIAGLERGSFQLRIVGDGQLRSLLNSMVEDLGLQDEVTLVGPVGQDKLHAEYAWADLFCLPSFAEGLPVVLMEAMATGLPVISTRIAGIPELVTERTGVLVSPGNADELAAGLQSLRSAANRDRLGRTARDQVLDRHVARDNAITLAGLFDASVKDLRL